MDVKDIKKVIEDLQTKPAICSDTTMITDSGYVITTRQHYEQIISRIKEEQS